MMASNHLARNAIGKLRAENCIFFACDIQERFVPLIHKMPSVIHTAKIMTNASNILHIPIVVSEQYVKAFGKTVPEIGLNSAKYVHLFEKKKFSMMTDELEKILTQNEAMANRKTALLYGIEAHVCVQQTALDLLERDYDVHVLADGVSSQRVTDREVALERMRQSGAFITTCESAMFMIANNADQPYFKDLSSLFNNTKNPRPPIDQLL